MLEGESTDLEKDQDRVEELCSALVNALLDWDLRSCPALVLMFGHILLAAKRICAGKFSAQRSNIMYRLLFHNVVFAALRFFLKKNVIYLFIYTGW